MWSLVQLQGLENCHFLAWGGQFLFKFDIEIPKTPVQRYGGLDHKIINNTCNTEENGTATCIKKILMMSLLVKPLGKVDYDFYTHQY